MWSDNESPVDLLGYEYLVDVVSSVAQRDDLLPATIGVFGDWGSGKSTLVRMVCERLSNDDGTLVLEFNGWLFEGYEDAKLALMGTIIDELADRKVLTAKGKSLVLRLTKRINWWRAAWATVRAGAAGYAIAGTYGAVVGAGTSATGGLVEAAKDVKPEDLGEFLREADAGQESRRGIREFRGEFGQLLKESGVERLVVAVDDLDRCSPETIIETLEAIKLFLFVPRTAFIIGADERLVRYAVRRRFPELPGERADVGRDYLEKLVQYPVRIPPMGRGETEAYLKLLLVQPCLVGDRDGYEALRALWASADPLADLRLDRGSACEALEAEVSGEFEDAIILGDRLAPVLAIGLDGNPRQCKRFLNAMMMRLRMAESKGIVLKRRTLAKLMLLEYLRPQAFKELARLQAAQLGRPSELATIEGTLFEPQLTQESKAGSTEKSTGSAPVHGASTSDGTPPVLSTWLENEWLAEWLHSEPRLGGVDLRAYFYFSRDKLDALGGVTLRMSPAAQEILGQLLSSNKTLKTSTLGRVGGISSGDASAILDDLARRVLETENVTSHDGPFAVMFEFVQVRPELTAELLTFLDRVPLGVVPFAAPGRVAGLPLEPGQTAQAQRLVRRWANSGEGKLANAAKITLKKMN